MIRSLKDKNLAKMAFEELFSSTNPFEPAGRTDLPVRVVLFPTDSYHLQSDQFEALIRAARNCNELSLFVSELESANPFDLTSRWKREHWEATNPTFEEYSSLPLGIENALYSENGTWGVLLSHELHGLLVCTEQFWQVFRDRYSKYHNDFQEFINYWERIRDEAQTDTNWLDLFVTHLTKHGRPASSI